MSQPDNSISAAKVQQNSETTKDKGQKRALERESRVRQSLMEGKLLWKRAEIASDYSDLNQGLYKQPGMLSEPAVQVRVHPQSDLSTAKVRRNSETTKDLAKKNCLLLHHSALIAGASARQLKQSWHRVPSIRKINQLSCQAGSKWWKVIQAFRLQRYEENWYYTHFLAQILVL